MGDKDKDKDSTNEIMESSEYENNEISVVTDEMEFSDQDEVADESDTSCPGSVETKETNEDKHVGNFDYGSIESEISSQKTNTNFATMLMDVLSSKSMENVITWLPEGNAFIVINEKEFTKYVLPICFELMKFESFVKRLFRWGFRALNRLGRRNQVFYHKFFLRDFPCLCKKISQKQNNVPSFDPLKTNIGTMINTERKLNYLALESNNSSLRLARSAQTLGMKRQIQQKQLQLQLLNRSAQPIIGSNVVCLNNIQPKTSYADFVVKNFFDRKITKIKSNYLQHSYTRKFRRHSMGL